MLKEWTEGTGSENNLAKIEELAQYKLGNRGMNGKEPIIVNSVTGGKMKHWIQYNILKYGKTKERFQI